MGYIFEALERAGDDDRHDDERIGSTTAVAPVRHRGNADDQPPAPGTSPEHKPEHSPEHTPERDVIDTDAGPAAAQSPSARVLELSEQRRRRIDDRLVTLTHPNSQMAEEYRAIRTSLLARWQHARRLAHTITSATPREGKTITSLNLGLSMAELGNRSVVILEADLRRPTFAKLLHVDEDKRPGLIAYLKGEAQLDDVLWRLGDKGPHLITAGGKTEQQTVQLLSSRRMAELLQSLRERFDHIIIDTPPVLELADAGIIGAMSDEVIMVTRMAWTPRPLVEQALQSLSSYNAKVAGVIATDQKRGRGQYYYRYGYRYGYHHNQRAG